jgi:hypothetical protein
VRGIIALPGNILTHPAVHGTVPEGTPILVGTWMVGIASLLVFAFVVVPAVFFKDSARRSDARKVLQQILDFTRRPPDA